MRLELAAALAALTASAAPGQTAPAPAPAAPSTVPATPPAPSPPAAPARVPAVSAVPAVAAPAPVSNAALATALVAARQKLQANDCLGVLAALDPVMPGLPAGESRELVQRLRLSCLLPAGRIGEADAVYRELIGRQPRDPGLRALGVVMAAGEHDLATAARRLGAIATDEPAALRRIEAPLVRQIRQGLAQDRKARPTSDALDLALARADWNSGDEDLDDAVRANAVGVLAAQGSAAEARTMLLGIEDPQLLVGMATERQYQPVWPEIEAQLGPHGATAVDGFAAARLDRYARQPNDDRALRDAARSFFMLNRAQDVVDLAGAVPIEDRMSEDRVATVRYGAQALVALGRREDALARLQKFETIDLAATPAAAAGLLEYAELLDEAGKPDQSLAAARHAIDKAHNVLTPWGLAWLKRTEACTLGTLNQAAPAKAAGDLLAGDAESNPAASIEGLLCLGRSADAARIAVATLARPDGADMLADQFQPQGAEWLSTPSRLRSLWAPLLARPDVKRAFDKVARILPRTLWPDPAPRAIPRDPSAPPSRRLA